MAAGLPVVVVNPRQVKDFAKSTGQLAKTDRLDAVDLAHFAEAVRPLASPSRPGIPILRRPPGSTTAGNHHPGS